MCGDDDDDDGESIYVPTTADRESSDVCDMALAVFKNSSGAAEPKATNVTAIDQGIVVVVVVVVIVVVVVVVAVAVVVVIVVVVVVWI